MTNQEYSFLEGFVKRASEYGYNEIEAIEMLKSAGPVIQAGTGAITGGSLAAKPIAPVKPVVTPAMRNESIMQPKQRAFNQDPRTGAVLTPAQMAAMQE